MAIGALPLIPLNRVQTTPDARFQRFGVNDAQLFGKSLIDSTAPAIRPAQAPKMAPRTEEAPLRTQPNVATKPLELPAPVVGYSNRSESHAGPGVVAKPGSLVDTKA